MGLFRGGIRPSPREHLVQVVPRALRSVTEDDEIDHWLTPTLLRAGRAGTLRLYLSGFYSCAQCQHRVAQFAERHPA